MDGEGYVTDIIISCLGKYGIQDFKALKPTVGLQLEKIEKYIQECIKKSNDNITNLRDIDISVKGICRGAGISRSTVYYSSDILKKYIEARLLEIDIVNEIVPKKEFLRLDEENKKLLHLVDNLVIDNIHFENLKLEVEDLNKEIVKYQYEINILKQKNAELISHNEKLEVELKIKTRRTKVVSFPKI